VFNLSERFRLAAAMITSHDQATAAYSEVSQSQSGAVALVGRQVEWPTDVKYLRPNAPPEAMARPYHVIVAMNSQQCKTLDPVTVLLRDLRASNGDLPATLVIYSADPWTAESYARINRLQFSVVYDPNHSFAKANHIQQEPLAMIVDREGRVVSAVSSAGRGRDMWPTLRTALVTLSAAK
jgi:hypothetical protein